MFDIKSKAVSVCRLIKAMKYQKVTVIGKTVIEIILVLAHNSCTLSTLTDNTSQW